MTKNKCGLPHHHGNDEERIISRLPSQETIDDVSILLKQLSDPTRLKIFWILCHMEECVINSRHHGHEQSCHFPPLASAESLRTDYIPPQRKRNVLQSRRYGNRE